jgi:WD40 repeat protein/serine/threonine protein kinase
MSVHEEGSEPIEGYWLIKLLGGGEYGSVWKATDHDGKPCVIKFISLGRQLTGAEIGALRKMKDVRHPYLAHVSSAWLLSSTNRNFTIVDRHPEQLSEIDELAIVTTYLDQSLAMILIRHKHQSTSGIPPFELLPYVAQAAQVIDFFNEPVHDLGSSEPVAIYHCDIRPANLLIGPDGDLRVSDFGMGRTRVRGGESSQPLVPTVIAPPARYSPPELILDESDNAQTDQYSLAISYYELRTGLLSFTSDDLRDTVQLRQAHIEGRLTFNEVPDAERIVLQKATSKKQADRFSSAGEMVRALRAAVTARQKLSRNLAAPANTDTDAHSIASPILRIMVFERGRTVFTDTFSGAIELGRQNNEQETPYSKTEVSPGYSRAVIAGYDEPYISRKHMKLESVGERSVRITNLSTKVLAWSHGDTASSTHGGINLPPALTTQDLPLPVTLVIGSVAVRVELAGQGQTPVGGSTSTPDVSVEDLLRTFGEMTTASLSADGLPDLCRKVARAVVETVGMDAAWVLLHESGGWSAVSEYFSPDVVRDPGWQPDQNVLRVLLKAKISFWVGPEQNAPDLKVRPKGVDVVFVAPILDSGSAVVGAVYGDCRQGARPVARTRVSKQQAMLVKSFANAIETMWERVHPVSVSPSSDVPAPPFAENPQTYRCTKCGREWAPDLAHDNEFVCTRKCGGFLELVGPTAAPIANAPTTSDPVATVRPLSATAPVGVLRGHGAEVICLAFHPDGHLLASGSSDRTARMWDVVAGTQLLAPFEHGATVSGLAFSPGGTRVVTACWDWGVRTWGVADGTELFASWRHAAKVTGVAVIDSQRIASGSADGHLSVWGVRGAVPSVGSANFGRLADLLWSRDFRQPVMAVTAAGDRRTLIVVGEQGSIGLYEADTGKELARSEGVMLGLSCCAVAPDGRRLVAGGGDGTVCVWELPSFQSLAGRTSHHGAVRGLAFFPDGRLIASGGSDGTVRIWDAESGSELSCWHGPQGGVNCVAISPDGRSIASGGADATICLWEAAVLTTAGAFLTPTRKPREEKATERDIDSADASALAVAAVHRFLHDRTSGVLVLENEHDQEELIALLVLNQA